MLPVRQHDHCSSSHLKLIEAEEPPMDSTVLDNYMHTIKQFPLCGFQGFRAGLSTNAKKIVDHYSVITYAQSQCYIHRITELLLAEGLKKQDRVVIYSKNSPLWLQSDLAISFAGGVTAPVYDTLGLDNIAYCINLVSARFVMVSGEYLPNVLGMLDQLPTVERIICFDAVEAEPMLQQAQKVFVQLGESGVLISDDTHSMYSISPASEHGRTATVAVTQEQPVMDPETEEKIRAFADLLQKKENKKGVKLAELTDFPDPTKELIAASNEYLRKRIESMGLKADDINSVIFTSGTSGRPKAVVSSHRNVISGGACLGRQFVPYHFADSGKQSSFLSYLPLAHVFERDMEHLGIYRGHLIYYSTGNTKNLTVDLKLAGSSLMIGVPRVYAKIYEAVMKSVSRKNILVRTVFKSAYTLKRLYFWLRPSAYRTGKMPIVDAVFKDIHSQLGGNIEYIISGSSALPGEVRQFLEVCSGARVTVGYGLTEASTTGLYNCCGQHFNSPSQLGFVCAFMDGVLEDRSNECEFSAERDQVGELMLKGPGIAQGYLEEWKAGGKPSVKSIVNARGYYATGDLCKLHQDGSVSFLRRLGLVVKLQHGEFVDLEAIESALETIPLVSAAIAHAEADKTAPVCIVNVDSKALAAAMSQEVVDSLKRGDKEAEKNVEKFVCELGEKQVRQKGLKGFNVPKAYLVLLDQDWAADPNLYTPSQKKKHNAFIAKYKDQIQTLWCAVQQRERNCQQTSQAKGAGAKLYVVLLVLVVLLVIAGVGYSLK